jgi:hypothetical protein
MNRGVRALESATSCSAYRTAPEGRTADRAWAANGQLLAFVPVRAIIGDIRYDEHASPAGTLGSPSMQWLFFRRVRLQLSQ